MFKVKHYLWLAIAATAAVAIVKYWPVSRKAPAPKITPQELGAIAKDIMSIGEIYRGPVVNHSETELVYTRAMEGGRSMCRVNLTTGKEERFTHTNQILRIFDYSPDDRYLIFRDLNKSSERLLILDRKTNLLQPVKGGTKGNPSEVIWLTTNSFAFTYNKKDEDIEICLNTITNGQQITETIPTQSRIKSMVSTSDHSVAFFEDGNFWSINVQSGETSQLSKFTDTDLLSGVPMWPNYSRENQEFLFCSDDKSNWRHLYRYLPNVEVGIKLKQLTFDDEHSYNGQWIQKGKGFAYISSFTNHFHFAIRPENPAANTNLFASGHAYGFTVGSDGNDLFAAASLGVEPPGIYKYDLRNNTLDCLTAGAKTTFSVAKMLPRMEHRVQSFDTLEIPYFLIEPRNLDKDKSYPLILVVPPEGNQFHNTWENYSQFFGNIGVFHAGINPRGCDGYGKNYARLNTEKAYEDVYMVYKELLKNRNVDPDRVYLMSYSIGVNTINRLVAEHPGLWAGEIIISGSPPKKIDRADKPPRYFIFMGEKDSKDLVNGAKEFSTWAGQNKIQATLFIGARTGHFITDKKIDEELALQLGGFLFN